MDSQNLSHGEWGMGDGNTNAWPINKFLFFFPPAKYLLPKKNCTPLTSIKSVVWKKEEIDNQNKRKGLLFNKSIHSKYLFTPTLS